MHPLKGIMEGFIGALVNIEVDARGTTFIRSKTSFPQLIESIGLFSNCSVVRDFTHQCMICYIKQNW